MPRWFSIAAIFIVTAFVLHAFLVIVSLAAGVVSGQGLLTMAGPVTFIVEFGLAAVITYLIIKPRASTPPVLSDEEMLDKRDADLEADARRRVDDRAALPRRAAPRAAQGRGVKWREARDLRAYATEALADLGDDDVPTARADRCAPSCSGRWTTPTASTRLRARD